MEQHLAGPAALLSLLTISTFCCSGSLEKQTIVGNTPLHYCCFHNKPECLKLLLKAKASIITSEWPGDPGIFSLPFLFPSSSL